MTRRSLNGCTNAPARPGKVRDVNTSNHSSNVTGMTAPPRRSTAETFASGAVSGITAVQGRPLCLANHATAWAMLPALAVHTPFASSSSDSDPISRARPADLEGADRLQDLELQVDLGVRDVNREAHQGGSQGHPLDPSAGLLDLLERDRLVVDRLRHSSNVVPTPSAEARSKTSRAAAASSTAWPVDL